MSFSESLNGGTAIIFTASSLATAFIFPAEVSILFLLVAYPCVVYCLGLMIGNADGQYNNALGFFFKFIVAIIITFAILYKRYGLVQNGEIVSISILDSIYFSITTLTTLGYGDFSPSPRIRHITSIQAIMGYIGLGIWIVLINGQLKNLSDMRISIRKHNAKLISNKSGKPPSK